MGCEYNCNLFSLEQLSQGKNKVFVSVLKQNKILHFTIGKNKIHFDFVEEGILNPKEYFNLSYTTCRKMAICLKTTHCGLSCHFLRDIYQLHSGRDYAKNVTN